MERSEDGYDASVVVTRALGRVVSHPVLLRYDPLQRVVDDLRISGMSS